MLYKEKPSRDTEITTQGSNFPVISSTEVSEIRKETGINQFRSFGTVSGPLQFGLPKMSKQKQTINP